MESKWICVKERLPEDDDRVLCCTVTQTGLQNIVLAYYDSARSCANWVGSRNQNVTHWMALPEPPEVEA